jgi:1-acyl-sn-glycerol-3-phosphate acyltransferase
MLASVVRLGLIALVRVLVGANARYASTHDITEAHDGAQSIYFTNHTSHLDTLALWVALPAHARAKVRPVAAKDYWGEGVIKRFIALTVLNAVLIDRDFSARANPLAPLLQALEQGDSLIFFPEGTRRTQAEPNEFKGGLYHLAEAYPQVRLCPVYLDTLHRSMPKGAKLPVPFICTVRFGEPICFKESEPKKVFLTRAREAILALI